MNNYFNDEITYVIFLAICHIVVLLVFFIFLLWCVYRLVRGKNTNRKEKIGVVAITCVIFNNTLQEAILAPVQLLSENLQKLFYIAHTYISADTTSILTQEQKEKILENNPLNELIVSIQPIFDKFPFSKLITAISFAILLYLFLDYIKRSIDNGKNETIASPIHKSVVVYNFIISFVLVLSLFLVISVCITIPYLNQISKPTTFTVARLDSTLNEYSIKDSFIVTASSSPSSSVKSLIFTDLVIQQFEKLDDSYRQRINERINNFDQNYAEYNGQRENTIESLNKFSKDYKLKENRYKKELADNYENQLQSIITDKGNLFQSSVRNFTDFVQSKKEDFDNTLQSISRSDIYNVNTKNRFVDQIKNAIIEFAKNNKQDSSYNPYSGLYDISGNLLPYQSYIAETNDHSYVPIYVKTGSEWGFLGFIANYLIKTQSSELVLLMGMIGFALLGASLFSFSQTNDGSNFIHSFKSEPLIVNFGNVLARGFGAALVIYLATKGGLAIFSAGTASDANGYILLLTCFVGAVFSEKVWNKIRQTLYGDEDNSKGNVQPVNDIKKDSLEEKKDNVNTSIESEKRKKI